MSDDIDYTIQYQRWHNDTSEELESDAKLYQHWIGSIIKQHSADSKVLDYGCGFGSFVYYLKQYFLDVEGLDGSKHQVAVAKRNALPVEILEVKEFSLWSANSPNKYDVIFLLDVLEHVPVVEQINFLRILVNTLKPGGVLYIKVPNANSLLANRWRYIDWTHHSSFTEASLDFVCLNSGLDNIEYFNDESSVKPRYWWLPRWGLRGFYLKSIYRAVWKLYLKAELGKQAESISVGYNLFARARKL